MLWWSSYKLVSTWKTHLHGDKETINSTPLGMVIPSIEEEEDWISKRPMERSNGGIRRKNTHWTNIDVREDIHQTNTTRDQQNRWEEDWSVPTSIERREDVTVRQELHRAHPTPPPSEDQLFTDWSSLDSPQIRTSPRNISLREVEQNINQPDNQRTQPGSEPAPIEAIGDVPCNNMSSLSTHQQLDKVDVRQIELDREVKTQLAGININVDADTQTSCPLDDVALPTDVSEQRPIQHTDQSVHDSES